MINFIWKLSMPSFECIIYPLFIQNMNEILHLMQRDWMWNAINWERSLIKELVHIQWNLKCHLDFLMQSAIDLKENLTRRDKYRNIVIFYS